MGLGLLWVQFHRKLHQSDLYFLILVFSSVLSHGNQNTLFISATFKILFVDLEPGIRLFSLNFLEIYFQIISHEKSKSYFCCCLYTTLETIYARFLLRTSILQRKLETG